MSWDYKRLAHKIVKTLVARLEAQAPLPQHLHLANNGFRTPTPTPVLTEQCLRMLLPHLEKSTGIHLKLTVMPALRNVYDVIQTPARSRYDLIRMDVAWADELAQRVFRPLSEIPFDWDTLLAQTVPELKDNYTSAGGVRSCVPYDPSTQLMFYRRDLFEDPTYRRMYFETYRRKLRVPKTFAEYNQVARFFTRSQNPASPVRFGSAVAVGNVTVSPSEFMPRLYEEGGNLLDNQGRICIDTPEALRALHN